MTRETIYPAIHVQGRGEPRRELAGCLRTGRAIRAPQRMPDGRRARQGKIAGMVPITERPAEAADRAAPGPFGDWHPGGAQHGLLPQNFPQKAPTRKTLGWDTPAERPDQLLSTKDSGATTA